MQGSVFILIRSVVPNADDRNEFDHWYATDHLPLIGSKMSITQGWLSTMRLWNFPTWTSSVDQQVLTALKHYSQSMTVFGVQEA